MAFSEIKYSKEFTWKKGDAKPTIADGVTEGSIGYEIDESADKAITSYKFLQGDWREV